MTATQAIFIDNFYYAKWSTESISNYLKNVIYILSKTNDAIIICIMRNFNGIFSLLSMNVQTHVINIPSLWYMFSTPLLLG